MNFFLYLSLYLFLLGSVILCNPPKISDQMISALRSEIQKISQTNPPNSASYIKDIHSSSFINSDTFYVSQTIEILQSKLRLSPEVINSFKNIIFSDSLTFQTFTSSILHQTGLITEFIGCARKTGLTAEIAYIQITSSGTTITQYNRYKTTSCNREWLFWNHCHDDWHTVPRGFTTAEISIIFNALRSQAYLKGLQQMNSPPHSLLNFDSLKTAMLSENKAKYPHALIEVNMLVNNNNESLIEQLIKTILAKIPEMKNDIMRNTSVVVDKIVNRGFTSFKEKASIQQINGVQDQYFAMFLNNLKTTINLPQKYEKDFESIMEVILYSTSNIWVVFDITFAINSGAECKYVCVMARHDEINKKTDWLVSDVAATFTLAPDVLIIQQKQSYLGGLFGSSQEKIVLKPASITKNQLNVVFEFFEVVSFERFAEILNINPNHEVSFIVPEIIGALTMAKSAVELVTSAWTSIVSAFKTSKSTELKEILEGKGFSYFSESGEMQKVTGLKLGYYNTFTKQLLKRIEVPDNKRTDFEGNKFI